MKPSLNRRRGSTLIIVSVLSLALLGCAALVTDYSVLLSDRNRLQRACDAGALAGASYLKRTGVADTDRANAIAQARAVALQNGVTAPEVPTSDITVYDSDTKIKVVAHRNRPLFFIRALGLYDGVITASAKAGMLPGFTPQVVPIGITPETRDAYQADRQVHELTLTRPQETDFFRTFSPTLKDPFVLTDYRTENDAGTHGSPEQMERQLAGTDLVPIQIGYAPSSLRDSIQSQSGNFEDGISAIFTKAAGSPWFDPPGGTLPSAWQTVGTKWNDIQAGTSPANNPRIVNLFITNGMPQQSGNYNYPVLGFTPVYIEQVTDDGTTVKMQVHFMGAQSGYAAQPVGLID